MDYTPLNRHEKYLNAIMNGDNDNLPKPENREEAYLYNIAMNSGGGGEDYSVKYTEQSLTTEQQAQARENIGAAASTDIPTDAVKYTAQTLTDAQKAQARTNIGAMGGNDDNKLRLGQIYAVENNTYKAGISALFGNALTTIVISSSDLESTVQYAKLYKFGDFMALIDDTVDPNKLSIRPLGDHAVGITKVGAWIRIESCYRMFFNLPSVTSLDLSMFDTSGVKNTKYMFRRCTSLTTLDLSSFDMTNVVDYTDMFGSSGYEAGITTLKCPKINPHDDIPLPRTLYSQDGTAYTKLPVTTGTSIELRQSWT